MKFLKRISAAAAAGVAILIDCGLSTPSAQAGFIITLTQEGTSVVSSGSGTLVTTSLHAGTTPVFSTLMVPSEAVITAGPSPPPFLAPTFILTISLGQ
jgi:hypothetical protein